MPARLGLAGALGPPIRPVPPESPWHAGTTRSGTHARAVLRPVPLESPWHAGTTRSGTHARAAHPACAARVALAGRHDSVWPARSGRPPACAARVALARRHDSVWHARSGRPPGLCRASRPGMPARLDRRAGPELPGAARAPTPPLACLAWFSGSFPSPKIRVPRERRRSPGRRFVREGNGRVPRAVMPGDSQAYGCQPSSAPTGPCRASRPGMPARLDRHARPALRTRAAQAAHRPVPGRVALACRHDSTGTPAPRCPGRLPHRATPCELLAATKKKAPREAGPFSGGEPYWLWASSVTDTVDFLLPRQYDSWITSPAFLSVR